MQSGELGLVEKEDFSLFNPNCECKSGPCITGATCVS